MTTPPVLRISALAGLLVLAAVPAHAQTQPPNPPPHGRHDAVPQDHASDEPKEPIPPITDADRKTAFPDVTGHPVHDRTINTFVLFDQLEWQAATGLRGANWDTKGWVGGDRNRFWFRTEGEADGARIDAAQAHALFGRMFARWWDVIAGVREDFRPGPARTWAAFGVQGLAPYWFEVEATGYVGANGRTHARVEVEYELFLTNRWILQPLLEAEWFGKPDPERQVAAGLSTIEPGLRLRYEFRRDFAPYIGVTWENAVGGTARLRDAAGDAHGSARVVAGLRTWF